MNKKIFGMALLAASLFSLNGMAQQPNPDCCQKKAAQCDKASKECVAGRDGSKFRLAKCNPYEGLTLTDAQKKQLDELDAKRRSACAERAKCDKEKRQCNDSLRMEARKNDVKVYLNEVKKIVGPEQYVVFLENMVVNAPGRKNHGLYPVKEKKFKMKANKDKRDGKRDCDKKCDVKK